MLRNTDSDKDDCLSASGISLDETLKIGTNLPVPTEATIQNIQTHQTSRSQHTLGPREDLKPPMSIEPLI